MINLGMLNLPALALFALSGFIATLYIYQKISPGSNRLPGFIVAGIVALGLVTLGVRELALIPSVWTASAVGFYGPAGFAYCITSAGLVVSLALLVIKQWRE